MQLRNRMLLASALVALVGGAAQAVTTYDANLVAPGFYNGTGNPNGGFTVVTEGDIELGLRAKYRNNPAVIHTPNNVYSVVPGPQTNATSGGNGAAANRAAWNYDFSINLNADGDATYLTLSQIEARLRIEDPLGNVATVNPLTHWVDNAGYGPGGENLAFLNAGIDFGAQNSQNPNFGDFPLAAFYNMFRPGDYTFTLSVYESTGSPTAPLGRLLATNEIVVNVVPTPAAALSGLTLLGGLVGFRRSRRSVE